MLKRIHAYKIVFLAAIALAVFSLFAAAQAQSTPGLTEPFSKKVFARELAAFLKIQPEKKTKCFQDLKKKDPQTPEICALKKAKIFLGKKTAKFKPESKANWKFVVESFCRAKKWTKKKNFAACHAYARQQGFFDADILPKKKPTYGELAKLIDRVNAGPLPTSVQPPSLPAEAGSTGGPASTPPSIPDNSDPVALTLPGRSVPSLSFTPIAEQQIGTNFFAKIALSTPMPNRFYLDEVYFLEGDIVGETSEEAFAFLCKQNENCENSTDFLVDTTNNGTHFKIPLHFKETGNFQIGVLSGRSGSSRVENISVLPEPSIPSGGQTAAELKTSYEKGKTKFSWAGSGAFTRLTIFQNSARRDYLFRQGTTSFEPDSVDFSGFSQGPASWFVTNNSAASEKQTIDLAVQHFYKIEPNQVEFSRLAETFSGPARFSFTAKALTAVAKKAAVTLPSGFVKIIDIASADIPRGQEFTVSFDLDASGAYIFEVNNPEGGAIVNVPVHVGGKIPLLPDYFALHPPVLKTDAIPPLASARTQLLGYINADRKAHGLPPVAISDELNSIAQAHTDNMVSKNFFGHTDPAGLTPNDRRKKAKYPASIRENLAKATEMEGVEQGLMRSPVHRDVILDAKMTKVGIGVARNSEGYIFATQNYSADPIREADMPTMEQSLFDEANRTRIATGLPVFSRDTAISDVARTWSTKMKNENFFATTDGSGKKLEDLLREADIRTGFMANIVKVSDKDLLAEEIVKQGGVKESSNAKIGVGAAVNEFGEIYVTTIYTP